MSKITREEVLKIGDKLKPILQNRIEYIDNLQEIDCFSKDSREWKEAKDVLKIINFINQPPQLDSNIEKLIDNISYELLMSTDEIEYNRFILKKEPRSATDLANDLKKIKEHIQSLNDENERLNKSDASKEQSSIDYYNEMKNLEVKIKQYEDAIDKVIYAWEHRLFEESMSVIEFQEIFNELKQIQGKE